MRPPSSWMIYPQSESGSDPALGVDNPIEGFDSQGIDELNALTSAQLEMLFQFGLFTGYSYFLQAPDELSFLANQFAQAGGSSAVFGGSYLPPVVRVVRREIVIPLPRKRVMRWKRSVFQRMPKPLGIWVRFFSQ